MPMLGGFPTPFRLCWHIPRFSKYSENRFILTIWQQAYEVLARANEVEIIGYSLPPSDSAARVGCCYPLDRAR